MASVSKRPWVNPKGEEKSAWVVRYQDGAVRRSKQFDKKKDADAFRKKVEAEIEHGTHVATSDALTVEAVCRSFMAAAEVRPEAGQIGDSRMSIYNSAVRNHIVPHLGKKRLAELTWADLEDWRAKLVTLGPRSRESYLTVFKMVEEHAIKRGFSKKAIVREFRRDAGSAKVAPIRTFGSQEATVLLRALAEKPERMRVRPHAMLVCAVNLAAFCGLRYGEIMGLTLGDIDFDRRIVRVRHSLTQWDLLKGPKTAAGRRDIPMPDHISALIARWIDAYYAENERGIIFRTPTGEKVGDGNWQTRFWHPLLVRAGLWQDDGRQYHFHALRHFAASWMIEHGLKLPDVASLLGHSKFDMTLQVYAHPIVGGHHRHEAFDRMSTSLLTSISDGPGISDALAPHGQ